MMQPSLDGLIVGKLDITLFRSKPIALQIAAWVSLTPIYVCTGLTAPGLAGGGPVSKHTFVLELPLSCSGHSCV